MKELIHRFKFHVLTGNKWWTVKAGANWFISKYLFQFCFYYIIFCNVAGLAVSGVRLHAHMPTHAIFCVAVRSSHAKILYKLHLGVRWSRTWDC